MPQFAHDIVGGLRGIRLRHHREPRDRQARSSISAWTCFHRFFALPDAEKRRYQVPGGGGARGYTPFGIETAKGAKHHDLKEFWHVGRELPPGHPFNAGHGA